MIIGRKLHLKRQRMTMSKRKKYIIAFGFLFIIVSIIACIVIKSHIYHEKEEAINHEIKLSWFGYGSEYTLETVAEHEDEINPIYIKTIERWEDVGLIKIMEETGVWTIEACEDVDVFDEGTIEYGILHGGISFADINYKEFNKAMINIDSELHKGTTDPRDMHDFLEEAALKEATNDYE